MLENLRKPKNLKFQNSTYLYRISFLIRIFSFEFFSSNFSLEKSANHDSFNFSLRVFSCFERSTFCCSTIWSVKSRESRKFEFSSFSRFLTSGSKNIQVVRRESQGLKSQGYQKLCRLSLTRWTRQVISDWFSSKILKIFLLTNHNWALPKSIRRTK